MLLNSKVLKWLLAVLYFILIIGLFGTTEFGNDISRLLGFPHLISGMPEGMLVIAITFASQALFIFSAGAKNLCQPVRRRRLIIPFIMFIFLMSILAMGVIFSIDELLYLYRYGRSREIIALAIIILSWILWGFVFFVRYKNYERYKILKRLVTVMIAGSLLELLVAIPSHIIVSKRPGCFAGLGTGLSILCGVALMLWSFGPGIILLFLRNKYQKEKKTEK